MNQQAGRSSLVVALWANAALLALITIVLIGRPGSPNLVPAAMAQYQQPIAGGSGIYIMPGQLSNNTWGCYLLDVDTQTLCAYQFYPGDKQLRLIAARNFRYDRKLGNFNTTPAPQDVAELVKKEQESLRVMGSNATPDSPEKTNKETP